jgi:DNA-binding MarR family transcriptional regulator
VIRSEAREPESVSLSEYQSVADLRAALRKFLRVSEQAARRHGLTQQRYLLLLMIKGAPDGSQRSTVTTLAERLQLAQSTVTELVARAEEAGLVARDPSTHDGRVVFFSLTPEGERRLAALVQDLRPQRASLARMVGAFAESQLTEGQPAGGRR